MDIGRIEHILPATRHLPPQDQVVILLALPTADDKAASLAEATIPADPDSPGTAATFNQEKFIYRYSARVFRGVRGVHRDGMLVEMPTGLDLDGREAWMRANFPIRWLPSVMKAVEREEDLAPEDERPRSASAR